MRLLWTGAVFAIVMLAFSAAPARAEDGSMWCKATAGGGVFYSAIFSITDDTTGDPAESFKAEVARQAPAAAIVSSCSRPAPEASAEAARNADIAATRAAGRTATLLDWSF